jgi:hypothetical protein
MDPDPDPDLDPDVNPDPAIFIIDLQEANKRLKVHLQYFSKIKSQNEVTKQ